jgi:hypothetical protein
VEGYGFVAICFMFDVVMEGSNALYKSANLDRPVGSESC